VIDHAFDGLGLRRLWAEVYAFDERKARLFEDLGFSQEARLREHHAHAGAYHDSLLFGLLRAERHQ
jgi:RimJ/RimL family protein N-acetyltransferase